ncbi:MAG: hypothetical protein JKX78_03835 [Alteromonadaceae bacterium]|jgi:hypothetical protein|nr:hypothetical protein [Alteromonadaceae bacterium]MBL4909018.1 hypothetical protein [Alteromonadaceae bacterium]MBL4909084.1 hypothetical protein [Alteromonadaceae bacterium]MBL4909150.1 hypothetical protein [Alteromonadaceae bacterium]
MTDNVNVTLTEAQLRDLIQQTITQTLTTIGVDATDPHKMQKDFIHLREMRESGEAMKKKTQVTLLGIFITGAIAAIALGIKEYFK